MPPDHEATPSPLPARPRGPRPLRLIAVFKLLQSLVIATAALTTLHLIRPVVAARLQAWAEDLPVDAQQDVLRRMVSHLLDLPTGDVKAIAGGALLYALLFLVEGVGLWRGKRWAEWLTVGATASLIPAEVWELARHPGWGKLVLIAVNVAVVWYLIRHLRHERRQAER